MGKFWIVPVLRSVSGTYVRMYVCVYVRVYVCITYVSMYVCVYVRVYVMYVCMYALRT
jgi:hypothetical protein